MIPLARTLHQASAFVLLRSAAPALGFVEGSGQAGWLCRRCLNGCALEFTQSNACNHAARHDWTTCPCDACSAATCMSWVTR